MGRVGRLDPRARISARRHCSASRSSPARSPDTTVACGLLWAAIVTPANSATSAATSAAARSINITPPSPAIRRVRRPRRQITRTASARSSAPATWAAATSPAL
nr:hypothetical protein [Nannocystis pusilla]